MVTLSWTNNLSADLYRLIEPPTVLKTKDPLVTIPSNMDAATLDLRPLQKKLIKRATKKAKAKHLAEITAATLELFGACVKE